MVAKVFLFIFIFYAFLLGLSANAEEDKIITISENSTIQATGSAQTPVETKSAQPAAAADTQLEPASTMEIEYQNEKNLFLPRFSNYIALLKPNYILPFYYTMSPDYAMYPDIPDNQTLKHTEFKAQLSLYLPLIKNLFYNKNVSINISYTQLIYWQLYTKSAWFRESDYEPNVALRFRIIRNMFGEVSLDHQSNGRGGEFERSWNRVIGTYEYSTENFFVQLNGWVILFPSRASNLYNPKIGYYLGYDKIILSYNFFKRFIFSVEANNIESLYTRGFFILTGFVPITTKFGAYLQYFNGYGQSLIEYNHKTQSFGVGFALNDWQ